MSLNNFYTTVIAYIKNKPVLEKMTIVLCKVTPYITALIYFYVIGYYFLNASLQFWFFHIILKPLAAFIICTVLRKVINRKRPYEVLDYTPLYQKDGGESFPSRHTLSAFIIAFTVYSVMPYLGIFTLVVACVVALSRIIAGLHYPSDVIAGIVLAMIIQII